MKGLKAVVLVSGGLDSAVTAAIARDQGCELYALTFRYGQRHGIEVERAKKVAMAVGCTEHMVIDLDLRRIGGSALTSDAIEVPKSGPTDNVIPATYVPARNTIFLSIALGWAETLTAYDIIIGVNALDYSGYPDCRPEFIKAFQNLANLATKAGVEKTGDFKIHAPLIQMTKAEIIRKGAELGVDFAITSSCYDPDEKGTPCGKCDSCVLRRKGFEEAGIKDPLIGV